MSAPPLLAQIFEALPVPAFLVDADVVVQYANQAARALASVPDAERAPHRRGGDLLRCIHADEDPEGCGRSEACTLCGLRNSVAEAFVGGPVTRRLATLHLKDPEGRGAAEREVLVSASVVDLEGERLAILTIEEVRDLVRLSAEAGRPA